jgi:hypothetical protein
MIYKVSFPNPNPAPGDDQFDTVDTDELKDTKLNEDSITELNEEKTVHAIKFEFGRRNLMPENVEQIYIVASCDGICDEKPEEILDAQTFVDEIARGAYARKTPDHSDYIILAKNKLKRFVANKILKNGSLVVNSTYNSFGYIYAGTDKIGTFENVNIKSETEITINDTQSIVDITKAQDVSLELFIEKKYSFNITINSIVDKNTIKINKIIKGSIVPEEVLSLKNVDEFSSYDDFLAARRGLVNTNLVADNFSLETEEFDEFF